MACSSNKLHEQIPSFTMSISKTHAVSAAKLVSRSPAILPGSHNGWAFNLGGGARRDRTDDLKLAKLPLSQLSYGPFTEVRALAASRLHEAGRTAWKWWA